MPTENSLLGLCVLRALELAGIGAEKAASGWTIMTAANRGAKCAGFIVLWAQVLDERGIDTLSIEDYGRAGYDTLRTSYRRLADFRALFPDEHDPTRLALSLLAESKRRRVKLSADLALAV